MVSPRSIGDTFRLAGRLPHRTRSQRALSIRADFYGVLNLRKDATKAEVKTAYRKLARQYHPDICKDPDAKHKFEAITDAYEVLSDDVYRHQYNTYGLSGLGAQFAHYSQKWGQGPSKGRSAAAATPGADVETTVALSFQEAALGTDRIVYFSAKQICPDCEGSCARDGSAVEKCQVCRGFGEVLKSQNTKLGRTTMLGACPACGGRGITIAEWCVRCGGKGQACMQRGVKVKIPAGVDEASVLRLKGQGDAGQCGAPPGDVYLHFKVNAQDGLRRDGRNVYSTLSIPFTDAILGGQAHVQTLRGHSWLDIPAGTQHGAVLTLPQEGVQPLGAGPGSIRGSHYFTVAISIPKQVSQAEVEVLETLANLSMKRMGSRQRSTAGRQNRRSHSQDSPVRPAYSGYSE
ncbi:hypothetical protein WJX72_002376 [[Myrmecia] bisecta]|uniref:Uncharacterized protein n=1 Tax=[Myrmecia] bisecta TaxID=41462 RepID=A0AAW1PPM5_9CHLO